MTVGPEQLPNHASCPLSKSIDRSEPSLVQGWIKSARRVPFRLRSLLLALIVIGVAGEMLTTDDRVQNPDVAGALPLLLMMTERDVRHSAP